VVVITKVSRKNGSAGQNLSGRARAIFTRAVNLRGFPPGVPTGVGNGMFPSQFRRGQFSSVQFLRGPPTLTPPPFRRGQLVSKFRRDPSTERPLTWVNPSPLYGQPRLRCSSSMSSPMAKPSAPTNQSAGTYRSNQHAARRPLTPPSRVTPPQGHSPSPHGLKPR
jgi:hypothetical protein